MTAHSAEGKKFSLIIAGLPEPIDLRISFGISALGAGNLRKDDEKRTSICFDLGSCGALGQAIYIIDEDFNNQMSVDWAKVKAGKQMPNIGSPIKKTYGGETKKTDASGTSLAGTDRENPLMNLSIDFTTFPAKFALAGQARTIVYDWRTRTVDDKGRELFKELLGTDGKTLNVNNAHEIVRSGDMIRRIEVASDGVSASQYGIHFRLRAQRLWIEPGSVGDVQNIILSTGSIQVSTSMAASASTSAAPVAAPAPAPAPTPVAASAPAPAVVVAPTPVAASAPAVVVAPTPVVVAASVPVLTTVAPKVAASVPARAAAKKPASAAKGKKPAPVVVEEDSDEDTKEAEEDDEDLVLH